MTLKTNQENQQFEDESSHSTCQFDHNTKTQKCPQADFQTQQNLAEDLTLYDEMIDYGVNRIGIGWIPTC